MLSYGEKLELLLLCDLLDSLKVSGDVDRGKIREAIASGNTWSLSWNVLPDNKEPSGEVVRETADILSMWRVLERDFALLTDADQQKVIDAVGFGSAPCFEGFDGNHDPHFGVASHLIENMGRFEEFSDRDLNSHTSSSLPRYRSSLHAYKDALRSHFEPFSADMLIEILRIRPHGD